MSSYFGHYFYSMTGNVKRSLWGVIIEIARPRLFIHLDIIFSLLTFLTSKPEDSNFFADSSHIFFITVTLKNSLFQLLSKCGLKSINICYCFCNNFFFHHSNGLSSSELSSSPFVYLQTLDSKYVQLTFLTKQFLVLK